MLPILPVVYEEEVTKADQAEVHPGLSKAQQELLDAVGFDPVSLDILLSRTGLEIVELSASLSEIELKGLIDVLPGGLFSRCK